MTENRLSDALQVAGNPAYHGSCANNFEDKAMRKTKIAAPSLLCLFALTSCQLRYQVAICRAPDGLTMVQVMIDRPNDARVRRVTISSGAAQPRTSPVWEMTSTNGQDRPLYRFAFGQSPAGFTTTMPPLAFDPAAGYRINIDGEWGGWLDRAPNAPVEACS